MQTRYRGDATKLAAAAASDRLELVMTLGGDGTVNEAVNGLLGGSPQADGKFQAPPPAGDLPALAALPGGNANVFTRSLQLPADPVDAAGRLIEDLAAGRQRRHRAGHMPMAGTSPLTPGSALTPRSCAPSKGAGRMGGHSLQRCTSERRCGSTTRSPTGGMPRSASTSRPSCAASDVYLCIVSNTAPWTYLGRRPVNTNPDASFDAGLDLLALRSLGTIATLRHSCARC